MGDSQFCFIPLIFASITNPDIIGKLCLSEMYFKSFAHLSETVSKSLFSLLLMFEDFVLADYRWANNVYKKRKTTAKKKPKRSKLLDEREIYQK